MSGLTNDSARRIQAALAARGAPFAVIELPTSARTAAEAAAALGCTIAQIAKSIVFRSADDDSPVLVVASGVNRIDERRVESLIARPIAKADAAYVRARTGFAIGGIPPLGHAVALPTLIDRDLLAHAEIWAAAGTPHAVFRLDPHSLVALTGGTLADIA
ncbi:MAG: YbaK/EbsC family protein [Gammaproteobacteria bacterium]|nr:YbaK/EbsC family protein [Gammaproteobacteria bacterium]MBI5619131.1 YbaK/EbsC family protein [Gammaproteobacteria bacterium]